MAWYRWGFVGVGAAVVVIAVTTLLRRRIGKRPSGPDRGIDPRRNNPNAFEPGEDFPYMPTGDVLDAAIADLPEKERIIVTLHYYEDIPIGEVADRLGISVETANKRLRRARSRLRPRPVRH